MTEIDPESGWKPDTKYKDYFIEKGLHLCDGSLPYFARGACIDECYETLDGMLVICNGEYGSQVNFCPYCGYKAKKMVKD